MDKIIIKHKPSKIEGECLVLETIPISFSRIKYFFYIVFGIISLGILFLIVYWNIELKRRILYNFCKIDKATHFFVKNSDGSYDIVQKIILKNNTIGYVQRHLKYIFNPAFLEINPIEFNFLEKTKEELLNLQGLDQKEIDLGQSMSGECVIDIPIPSSWTIFCKEIFHPFFIFQFCSVFLWCLEGYFIVSFFILFVSLASALWNLIITKQNLKNIREMAHYVCEIKVKRKDIKDIYIKSVNIVPGDVVVIEKGQILPFDCLLLNGEAIMDECSLNGESQPSLKSGIEKTMNYEKEIKELKTFCLYAGTNVIQVHQNEKKECYALVLSTSFSTLKGQLVRNILYPKPTKFKFFYESMKFIVMIGCIVLLSFFIVLPKLLEVFSVEKTIFRALDVITIAIPVYLPAALNLGISYALIRLKEENIYCISPQKVVIGNIDTVCFDKTGTITEEFMNFIGFLPCHDKNFNNKIITDMKIILENKYSNVLDCMSSCHSIVRIPLEKNDEFQVFGDPMEIKAFEFVKADFFSESIIKRNDLLLNILKRYEFSSNLQRMSVIVSYENSFNNIVCYTKGSPEICKTICHPSSIPNDYEDMVDKYSKRGLRILSMCYKPLSSYSQNYEREMIENEMIFLGFLMFENPLKKESKETIKMLLNAKLKTKIITGDNIMTAVNVAKKCKIMQKEKTIIIDLDNDTISSDLNKKLKIKIMSSYIDNNDLNITNAILNTEKKKDIELSILDNDNLNNEDYQNKNKMNIPLFEENLHKNNNNLIYIYESINDILNENGDIAISGRAFEYIFIENKDQLFNKNIEKYLDKFAKNFLEKTMVFARMTPHEKKIVIEYLQHFNLTVAMVGDGANDCGALKQADIGQTEASVSASFTAKDLKISSIVELIKQNRAGLVTSILTFKFIALYALTEFTSTNILYYYFTDMSNGQYFYIDFVISCMILGTMGLTDPYPTLSVKRPNISLFSFRVVSSVFGLLILQFLSQIVILETLKKQIFYNKNHYKEFYNLTNKFNDKSMENGVIFLFSNFLYVAIIISISQAKPFRKAFYTNKYFCFTVVFLWVFNILLTMYPGITFGLIHIDKNIESKFRSKIVIYAHIVAVIFYFYENWVCTSIDNYLEKRKLKKINK